MTIKEHHLSVTDILGLAVCWAGLAGFVYITKDSFLALCALIGAYYLTRWIILRG